MVTNANTETTLNALHKEIYADSIEELIPDGVKLIKKVKFAASDKELGDQYIMPAMLAHEAGFSYGSGVFTLNDPVEAKYQEAQVNGKALLLRSAISYSAAARMSSGGKKSFIKWTEMIYSNLINSMSKRLEIQSLYGESDNGIGRIDGAPVVTTNAVMTLATAEWAAGIWAGSEGSELDAYDTTGATQRNTNAALVIEAVDLDARTVEVSGNAADLAALADTDVLWFRGSKGAQGNGVDKILTNTGTLYNIDASAFNLWQGSTFSAGSADLTFEKVNGAIAKAVEKGLEEKVCTFVSPKTWTNLQADQAALRRYPDAAGSRDAKMGPESITYYGQNGVNEIIPSIYIKEGEAFVLPEAQCKRIGSTDMTMNLPGSNDRIWLQLPQQAGYEVRCFTEQNFFIEAPAKAVKITGIVNS